MIELIEAVLGRYVKTILIACILKALFFLTSAHAGVPLLPGSGGICDSAGEGPAARVDRTPPATLGKAPGGMAVALAAREMSESKSAALRVQPRIPGVLMAVLGLAVSLSVLTSGLSRGLRKSKRSEGTLEIFKNALENSTDAIGFSTPEGRHYYQNRAFDRLFGEVGVFPPDTLYVDKKVGEEVFKTIMSGGQWAGEVKMYSKDRQILDIFLRAYANKDGKGNIISLVGIHNDITERIKAQEAFINMNYHFKGLSEHAPFGMAVFGRDGVFSYVNPRFKEISGYDLVDVPNGKTWFRKAFPNKSYRQEVVSAWMKDVESIRPGDKMPRVFTVNCKNGTQKMISFMSVQLETGEFLTTLEDVTERRRADDALRESELKYRTLVDSADDSIFIMKDSRFVDCNKRTLEFFSCDIEDMVGRHPSDWSPERQPDGRLSSEKAEENIKEALDGAPQFFEWTHRRMDGTLFDTEVSLSRFELGGEYYLQAIVRDIGERKKAEEALKAAEENYRNIFLNSQVGLFRVDMLTGRLIDANDAMAGFFGYEDREALLAEPCRIEDRFLDSSDYGEMVSVLKRHGEFKDFEASFRMNDGSTSIHRVSARVIPAKAWVEGVAEDITERKNVEEEREKLQAQLHQAQKMESIGTLAGGIAHNFNNILMGIQGRASLMMLGKDSSHPDHEHLKGVEEYVKNAVELTKDLLGFARGGKYEVKPTDLNDLIERENSMFGRTKKEIRIHGAYEESLWVVEVDPGQIRQALLNLYVNAWQAMPGGGDLYIRTENVVIGEGYLKPFEIVPGEYVKISVTDTGTGMDESTREKVFDPFFSTKDAGQGSGLGLASVYGIIKNHGGFINVYSEKGEGTTFNVYLPASEKGTVKEESGPERHEIQQGRGNVLLVDDEGMIVEVGQMMLERMGYRVLIAAGGEEALALYKRHKEEIDLVILDMIMPGMGGGEVYDRLKEIDGDVRVLLSSGYSINGQARGIMARGCGGFIQKPFAMEELSRKVKELLNGEQLKRDTKGKGVRTGRRRADSEE